MNQLTDMNKRAQSLVLAMLMAFSCFSQFNRHLINNSNNPTHDHSLMCVLASLLGFGWTADHHHHHVAEDAHAEQMSHAVYSEEQSSHAFPWMATEGDWALAGLYILMSWTILIGLRTQAQEQSPIILLRTVCRQWSTVLSIQPRTAQPRAPPVQFLTVFS